MEGTGRREGSLPNRVQWRSRGQRTVSERALDIDSLERSEAPGSELGETIEEGAGGGERAGGTRRLGSTGGTWGHRQCPAPISVTRNDQGQSTDHRDPPYTARLTGSQHCYPLTYTSIHLTTTQLPGPLLQPITLYYLEGKDDPAYQQSRRREEQL